MTQPLDYASGPTDSHMLRRPKLSLALRISGLLLFTPPTALALAIVTIILLDVNLWDDAWWLVTITFALGIGFLPWRLHRRRWFHITSVAISTLLIPIGGWLAYRQYMGPRPLLREIGFEISLVMAGTGLCMMLAGLLGLWHRRLCEW